MNNRPVLMTALSLLLAMSLPGCAEAGGDATPPRSIAVTGQGEAAGAPDQASVSLGVQTLADTAIDAARRNEATVREIMQALDAQGIAAKDIQTTNYSIWPEQRHDRDGNAPVITGYRVQNVVNVAVRDIGKVGAVLGAATEAGANTVHGITFAVADTADLEQAAREKAMTHARERAESLASLAGVELGEVLSVSMGSGGGPVPMGGFNRMAMAEAAPSVSPGELSVSVQLQVTWAIRD